MGLQNDTSTTVIQEDQANTIGTDYGQSATDPIGFYGKTPVTQPTNASQAAVVVITDSSGGAASATTGMQALTSTYNSGIIANSLSTLAARTNASIALTNQLRADLVTLGLIKGS